MPYRILSALILLLWCFGARATDNPLVLPSSLQSVTVYRSGAEMIHRTTAQLPAGSGEIVIEGISNKVDVNSIQVSCPAAVTIMGVEYGNNFLVNPEVSPRIAALRDSADKVQRELDRVAVQIRTTQDVLEVLKANRDIKGQQAGLSVAELMKLVDYYKKKSTELQDELAAYAERQKKLSELLGRIRNQIREEESRNTRTSGQLRLQVSVATPGRYDFSLSYITPNAYWAPFYDIRVDDIRNPLKLIYKARIVQTTGIDWKKVKLALSTSLPTQWGQAPLLQAWFLSYINPVAVMERNMSLMNSIPSAAPMQEVVVTGYGAQDKATRREDERKQSQRPVYIVNGAVMSESEFRKINPSAIRGQSFLDGAQAAGSYGAQAAGGAYVITLKEGLEDYVSVTNNELDVTFDIDLPYDVPTNGKEQTAVLKEYAVPSFYKYYSVPKLDKDSYLLAEVPGWEKLNLLPGEANIIFEGTYVGKSFIDPASTSDTLNLTLGRDRRMVVKKEKLVDYSSVKFLGTNKLQKFTYELTVRNNKKDTVHMILKDQYPLSTNKEIEVELLDDGKASVNPENGVLTWKFDLAPGETRKVRFSYSVKFPKDKQLNL